MNTAEHHGSPVPPERPFKVFYSWQSDLPDSVNLKLVRNALNQAANSINIDDDVDLHVQVDEATRNVAGSPNIADTIFAKIRNADVFVCDLSKVAELISAAGTLRKYCNPNVAIELGYAIRVLGWGRIVIVFNKAYGVLPDDLPFDAQGHRTSSYQCSAELNDRGKPTEACKLRIASATGELRKTLADALKLVATENPLRPQVSEIVDPNAIRRMRDLEQLKKVFYWINLNMMDRFIDRLLNYGRMGFVPLDFLSALGAVIGSAHFHLYDATLRDLILEFHGAWINCLKHEQFMTGASNSKEIHFHTPGDIFSSKPQEVAYYETVGMARPLREKLNALLCYVREKYIEIDLATAGEEAIDKYATP